MVRSRDRSCAPLRHMPEDHFGEEIAAGYDDPSDEMFQPAACSEISTA